MAAALDADILLQARMRADGEHLRIESYASAASRKSWVESFAGSTADTETLERDIGAAIGDALDAGNFATR